MAEIITLHGKDYPAEKAQIEEKIDASPWFVLDSEDASLELEHYISNLFDNYDLGNSVLARLRIGRNFSWPAGAVTLIISGNEGSPEACFNPADMRSLLTHLQPEVKSYLVIENDDSVLLANILQQLIYLDYPITKLDVALRREYKDKARVQCFMENLTELAEAAQQAKTGIESIEIPEHAENRVELREKKDESIGAYHEICEQLKKAESVEMKVAFAASKKTGKSVLVNCLLGRELAPTSLEMATPNTCMYKKSADDKYHLHWLDEKGEVIPERSQEFTGTDDIHKELNKHFKAAEKDGAGKFAINDLVIEYPLDEGHKFSNYKIYDTPGPDAAGTAHHLSAEKAIEDCDASVFAIDYSKYLTDTEENYLQNVKEIFEKKGKFHTLLFTINKMDLTLGDSGAKSRVKSIDFIRNRLRAINGKYGNCVIFATSAQDFFNTQMLEQAAREDERLKPLLAKDADWGGDFRKIKKQLKGSADNALMTAMSNLEAETTKIEDLLEYEPVNINVMRDFSGMPQMLSYLEYVLQSKAREEIVNHIAHTVGMQASNIKSILGQRGNLIVLLQKNESEIKKITAILDKYSSEVNSILEEKISYKIDHPHIAPDGFLSGLLRENCNGVTLGELIASTKNSLRDRRIELDDALNQIWSLYSDALFSHIKKLKGQASLVSKEKLALEEREVSTRVETGFDTLISKYVDYIKKHLEQLGRDLTEILSYRFGRIDAASKRCRSELKKQNVELTLPELPKFDVALPQAIISSFELNSSPLSANLKHSFSDAVVEKGLGENFWEHGIFFWKYKATKTLHGTTDLGTLSDGDIWSRLNQTKPEFIGVLMLSNFASCLEMAQKQIEDNAIAAQMTIKGAFESQISDCKRIVENFRGVVDEREIYRRKSALTELLLTTLEKIQAASADFLDLWNEISRAEAPALTNCGGKS